MSKYTNILEKHSTNDFLSARFFHQIKTVEKSEYMIEWQYWVSQLVIRLEKYSAVWQVVSFMSDIRVQFTQQ